jgi:hypothetical protein
MGVEIVAQQGEGPVEIAGGAGCQPAFGGVICQRGAQTQNS